MLNASSRSSPPGKPPLRVLIASRHLPECTGGLAAYQRGLAIELGHRQNMEVRFVAAEGGGPEPRIHEPLPAPSQVLNCRCRRRAWMSMASRPLFHPLLTRVIAAAFRKAFANSQWRGFSNGGNPDVVHFVGTGWDFAGFGFLDFARRVGARFTVWPAIHPGQWGDDVMDLRLYRAADAVFCQSRFEVAHIVARGVDPGKTVLCGLPPMCLPGGNGRALRERWGPGKGPVVLFLGRRDEAKGYPALLEAWKRVLLQHPDALLVLSGPGGSGYEPLLNSLPAGSFLDLGIADEETKSEALAACDLFCLPSSQESFGIVYAEAWSYGKPVICGPAPASREWIAASGGGEWCAQHPEDLARALVAMLGAPALRAAMGLSGMQFQSRTLTWDAVAGAHRRAFGIGACRDEKTGCEGESPEHLPLLPEMNRKTQGPAPHRILLSFHTFGSSFIHMPSLLRRSGFAVDAVFTDLHPLRNLRGISKRFLSQPSEWAATIERLLATGEYCFYQNVDEPGLLALYRHQWTRETARLLPFPPGEAFARTLGSKIDFHKWCLDHSLPVPESHVCETFEEARALARKLPGSWFLKGDAGSGGDTVALSSDIDAGMGAKSGRWLVQRNEGDHISSGVFLVVKGKILAWFGFTKVISLNRGLGPVIHGRVEIPPDTAALCERIAAASGVTGLTGFDFARSPDHGLVIIDSQLGRMVPTQHFCLLYGVDFGAALGRHLRGEDPAPCHPGSGPDFIKFPEVLQLVCQGGLPELLRNLKGKWEMPLAPPGECTVAISNAWRTLVCETRVLLRRERRILCRLRDR